MGDVIVEKGYRDTMDEEVSPMTPIHRDIVVIGASAGGIEALRAVMGGLPPDLPAAILVVMHMPPGGPSALPGILDRAGPLPAVTAQSGMKLRHGKVYVAPPGHHLLLVDESMTLTDGPTESGHRPAINALFRSAALVGGARSVGVVLSGVLDDGTLGLRAIVDRGGLAIVQDPADAVYAGMPESALRTVRAHHVRPAAEIGELLTKLVREPAAPDELPAPAPTLVLEDKIARNGPIQPGNNHIGGGTLSSYTCPDCQGPLIEIDPERGAFRCRTGHGWSAEALLAAQGDELQRALWVALRTLDEKVQLARKLQRDIRTPGHFALAKRYETTAQEYTTAAETLRRFLLSLPETGEQVAQ